MSEGFKRTERQIQATKLLTSDAKHIMLYGGARSGKTFILMRSLAIRAMSEPESRHAIWRRNYNHVRASIWLDTFPKMMRLCFPKVPYKDARQDGYTVFPHNNSEIWFGGLDDKERTEKVLGQEYATLYFNEVSQIPYSSITLALTRLAQKTGLKNRAYYDCNPPSTAHWSYKQFVKGINPESKQPVRKGGCAYLQMNSADNLDNLPDGFLQTLEDLPERSRRRFLDGQFADVNEKALWHEGQFDRIARPATEYDWEKWLDQQQRVVIGLDPSGTEDGDAQGIVAASKGHDGRYYVLSDATGHRSPSGWARAALHELDRFMGDAIVAETNYGADMVVSTVHTERQAVRVIRVHASRGKAIRAEPIAALYEQKKVSHVGEFPELEDEMVQMTPQGYEGIGSPNRLDALVWALTELSGGIAMQQSTIIGLH